jgi:hypothetical protein
MSHIGQLQVGDRARVCGYVDTGRSYRRKLLSMGLRPGTGVAGDAIALDERLARDDVQGWAASAAVCRRWRPSLR